MNKDIKSIEEKKAQILKDFAKYIDASRVEILKFAGLDIIETKREGACVWDITGKKYIDCFTSAGIHNVGRRNKEIIEALKMALDKCDIGSFLLFSEEKALLAKKLAEITPGDLNCVCFGTGGGEANDFAIKLARGYTGKTEIISSEKGYHGHVGFSLSAAGRETYKQPFHPLIPGFKFVPFGDISAVAKAITDNTAAIILEPIQGEGGINIPPDDFFPSLRRLCDEKGIILILDEVQTGFCRTGKMFCCEHWNIVPDIMTVAKSLGGSIYPISATIYREKFASFLQKYPLIHFSTFGGSDLGCVVAIATIDYLIRNKINEHVIEMAKIFNKGLMELKDKYSKVLSEVRQKGLMIGLEFTSENYGPLITGLLAKEGVIALYSAHQHSVMRLMPSLIINEEEVKYVLTALDKAMSVIAR